MYQLTETIEQLLGPLSGTGVNAMASCPQHEDRTPSLSIHQDEGVWKCHACGAAGDLAKLATIVGVELDQEFYWDRAIRSVKEVPPVVHNHVALANMYYEAGLTGEPNSRILAFTRRRGIADDARHHFWLGWNSGKIAFPYHADEARKKGNVTGIKYRDPHGRKFSEPGSTYGLYNVEAVRGAGRVLLCEGESDTLLAWSILRHGWAVAGVSGAIHSKKQWELWALDLIFAREIYVAFDADRAGDDGAATASAVLGDKARRIRPDEGLDLSKHFEKYRRLPDGLEDGNL